MKKMYDEKKLVGSVRKTVLRFLRFGGTSALAAGLLSNFAMAQPETFTSTGGSAFAGATIHKVGLPLAPLSPQQMSTETAQGIPSGSPALSSQSQGNNSVLLWDEVAPGKAASPSAPVSGTVTLNIVH